MANSYVTLDLMRPNSTLIDITDSFNGRVGDSESYVKLWFKSNGLPYDLASKTVGFYGIDSKGTKFQIAGTAKTDQAGDGESSGRISFYFPSNTFQTSGAWDDESTFFAISDTDGNRLSTVNVHLNVLPDNVEMGIDSAPFFTDLEKIKNDMNKYCDATKVTINGALSELTDSNSNLNQTLSALKTQVTAYQDTLKTGSIPSKDDFNAFTTTVNASIKTIQDKLGKSFIVGDRGTALTPQQYIDQHLGESVTEWQYADLILGSGGTNPWSTVTGHADVYGYLHTEVTEGATEGATQGVIMQEFKGGWSGAIHVYVRTNATKNTWTAWKELAQW